MCWVLTKEVKTNFFFISYTMYFFPNLNKFLKQLTAGAVFWKNTFNVCMEKSMCQAPTSSSPPTTSSNFNVNTPSICDWVGLEKPYPGSFPWLKQYQAGELSSLILDNLPNCSDTNFNAFFENMFSLWIRKTCKWSCTVLLSLF